MHFCLNMYVLRKTEFIQKLPSNLLTEKNEQTQDLLQVCYRKV